jgi:DNA polymerase III delta subunit
MLSIFHGENTLASRNVLNAAIEKFKRENLGGEIIRLNGDKITETDLVEAIEAGSLFSVPRLVVIEGLLSRRPAKVKQKLIEFLLKGFSLRPQGESLLENNVCLWEPKPVAAGTIGKFAKLPNSRIQEFKLARSLFKLLDSLRPENGRQMSQLANETLKTDPAEVAMLMLGRRVAQLLVAKSAAGDGFSGLAEWQIQKLKQQTANWSEKQLIDFHRRLVEIDEAVKTGATPADFAGHLDILLLSL